MKDVVDIKEQVAKLIEKAVTADTSDAALRFSQAALNVAHTKHALIEVLSK